MSFYNSCSDKLFLILCDQLAHTNNLALLQHYKMIDLINRITAKLREMTVPSAEI